MEVRKWKVGGVSEVMRAGLCEEQVISERVKRV